MNRPLIALMTDFGTRDSYVGVMKSVMLGICPHANIVDLTHEIPPQDIRTGALALLDTYRYLPPGAILVAVVDPGVGSARRAVAIRTSDVGFVGPDNGLFSYVIAELRARGDAMSGVELSRPEYRLPEVSQIFHGRDIFAPAAAYWAAGVAYGQFGDVLAIESLVTLPVPMMTLSGQTLHGEVVRIDHFGNLITSLGAFQWLDDHHLRLIPRYDTTAPRVTFAAAQARVSIGQQVISGICKVYAGGRSGEGLAMIGSSSALEIAINQGSAAAMLNATIGDPVSLHFGGHS